MIKAIIVEDEAPLQQLLLMLIREVEPDIEIVGLFDNVEDAATGIEILQPQVLFLDIMLPGGTSFDLLERIPHGKFEVIFVTAYDSYMLEAFRHAAAGYVLKPVDRNELRIAITNARKRIQAQDTYDVSALLQQLKGNYKEKQEKIAIPTQDGFLFVAADELIRCESDRVYTWVYLKGQKSVLCSYNLGEFRKLLPDPQFFQAHKSHIISLRHVASFNGRESTVEMDDGSIVPVSRRNKISFLNNFALLSRE